MLDPDGARALEPALSPVFSHALNMEGATSISDPLALTRAYAARFAALGGVTLVGDAGSLHRTGTRWRVETAEGPVDATDAVVALGPWSPDVLAPLGIRLPMAVKRGYHLHFRPRPGGGLSRPMLDADVGYVLAPMQQGIRLTTGAEFADRDAPPTPVQLDRLMPAAKGLFPLGEPVEAKPWMGQPSVLCGFPSGDRPRARTGGPLARLRPRALGPDARGHHRPAGRRSGHQSGAGGRPGGVRGGTILPACMTADVPMLGRDPVRKHDATEVRCNPT